MADCGWYIVKMNQTDVGDALHEAARDFLYAHWQLNEDPWPRLGGIDEIDEATVVTDKLVALGVPAERATEIVHFVAAVTLRGTRPPTHRAMAEWVEQGRQDKSPTPTRRRLARKLAEVAGVSERTAYRRLESALELAGRAHPDDYAGALMLAVFDVTRWAGATKDRQARRAQLEAGGRSRTAAVQWERRNPATPVEAASRPRRPVQPSLQPRR